MYALPEDISEVRDVDKKGPFSKSLKKKKLFLRELLSLLLLQVKHKMVMTVYASLMLADMK